MSTTTTHQHPDARSFLVLVRIEGQTTRGRRIEYHLADDAVDGKTMCGLRLAHVRSAGLVQASGTDRTEDPHWSLRCGRCYNRLAEVVTGIIRVPGRSNRED